ncbi:hypothetical protein C8J57DRAFT_554401 [Mycena rebaudengoi]|nr:hypothetical protein C8J57DRAFT_554401 [Mycena rebaudengoi]
MPPTTAPLRIVHAPAPHGTTSMQSGGRPLTPKGHPRSLRSALPPQTRCMPQIHALRRTAALSAPHPVWNRHSTPARPAPGTPTPSPQHRRRRRRLGGHAPAQEAQRRPEPLEDAPRHQHQEEREGDVPCVRQRSRRLTHACRGIRAAPRSSGMADTNQPASQARAASQHDKGCRAAPSLHPDVVCTALCPEEVRLPPPPWATDMSDTTGPKRRKREERRQPLPSTSTCSRSAPSASLSGEAETRCGMYRPLPRGGTIASTAVGSRYVRHDGAEEEKEGRAPATPPLHIRAQQKRALRLPVAGPKTRRRASAYPAALSGRYMYTRAATHVCAGPCLRASHP